MEQSGHRRKVKTIIIPRGAFDVNDTIVLKVPQRSFSPFNERRSASPEAAFRASYFYNDPPLPRSINERLEKAYYEGFQNGQRLVHSAPLDQPVDVTRPDEHKTRSPRRRHCYVSPVRAAGIVKNEYQEQVRRKLEDRMMYFPTPSEGYDPAVIDKYKRALLRKTINNEDSEVDEQLYYPKSQTW
ncbi:unnamed protein product [Phyllotreta striolata]|uniref:Uncharacterized protein n=1 Tax=Phyllotreta striolata TaxID=444603 RepID=A0A9N9TLN4_PHYSR|nr:unnamed protein product [Phyllotreta striolata]